MNDFHERSNRSSRLPALMATVVFGIAAHSQAQVGPLLWEDNFDTLNSEHWNVIEGDGCPNLCGWGNQELEYYQGDNVSIEPVPGESGNSAIVLEARNETVESRAFTSGKLDSKGGVSIQYGMIETRIRVPDLDTGLWPAFWLLGTSTASWPAKGEIDMMEMGHSQAVIDETHPGTSMNRFVGSNAIFYAEEACTDANPTCAASTAWQTDNAYVANTSLSDRFVTYRLYWTDQSLRFSVVDNGVEYDMYDAPIGITDASDEFRQPFYLLMNMAVGGTFTDAMQNSEVTAPLPAKMYIDYVRVYEYNGMGEVTLGNPVEPETGTFGVFTEQSGTSRSLEAGETSDIYIWSTGSLAGGNEPAYEGSEVISWDYTAPGQWFGGGVQSRQPLDMSNFEDGHLSFRIKVPTDVGFRVGITDTYTNEHYIDFPAGEEKYGLVRNGDWSRVSIPVSDLRGDLVALQSISYPFALLNTATTPARTVSIAIDDIVWEGGGSDDGGTGTSDSDGDGVDDSADQCPGTASGAQVNANGCSTDSVKIQAEDYVNFVDSDVGNNGGAYRSDDVDIEATSDTDGGYNVGWTTPGEWLEYDLNLAPGTYQVTARVASLNGGGQFSVSRGGASLSSSVNATGGWQNWASLNLGELEVSAAGTLRLDVQTGDFNLNWLRFEQVASDGGSGEPPTGPYGVSQVSASEAEFYVDTSAWADVHYSINGGSQLNVRMTQEGSRNVYRVTGLSAGDTLSYHFTYWNPDTGSAVDTAPQTFVME
ncbi:carbohydrate-binding domain-containing protein [Marinimicrobium agarilyticum]|uniref:carbohydrate-binding domain-containing protein n=1 Tax=Marinimicrobium agarilyticum TaxID=306546 RepID=UPI00068740AF|nr:carbohydrate-binding domain-containing protein [Marinimicrobium agarilyticum]